MQPSPADERSSIRTAWPVAGLVLLACLTAVAYAATRAPSVVPSDAPAERFSAERAWPYLETLVGDGVPHPLGSPQNTIVRERLMAILTEAGYEPTLQSTEVPIIRTTDDGFEPGVLGLHNVLVRRPGTHVGGKAVLIASHYDSAWQGPGASDDGVAVAVMLEIAARLRDVEPLRNDVIFLFTDGEERGLLGARAFVEAHPWFADVGIVVNLEARGSSGPSLMFQTAGHSTWLTRVLSGARRPITCSLLDEAYQRLPNDTDFTLFMEHGLTGCNFAFIGDVQHYHTAQDDLEHASPRSLQHHGDNAWHLVREFGDADLDELPAGEAVYFDLLGLTIVRWPEPMTWALVAIAVALLVATWWRWRSNSSIRTARVIVSVFLLPAALATTFAVGAGVARTVGMGGGWPDDGMRVPLLAAAVVWPAALAAVTGVAAIASRCARPQEICLGMWICLAAITIATTSVAVGATYLLVVPMLVSLGCACSCRSLRPWIGLATLVAIGVTWVPSEFHILDAFGWPAGFVSVRAGIVLLPLLPLLAGMTRRGKVAFGASGAGVAIAAGVASCIWQGAAV